MATSKNMIGQKIGQLLVIAPAKSYKHGSVWTCRCDCGVIVAVRGHSLRKKNPTQSCGCINPGKSSHGHNNTNSPTYRTWMAMKQRCSNPKNIAFDRYGGRGISVCQRWQNSFENFINDMGPRPPGHTIERRNVDGNYTPDNCCWIPNDKQCLNRRSNVIIEFNGKKQTVTEWSKEIGIPREIIYHRIKAKWPIDKVLSVHLFKKIKLHDRKSIYFNGKSQNLQRWSEETGIPYMTLLNRIRIGKWSIEKALTTPVKIRNKVN